MSLRSKKTITICRAIPAFIPRKLALDVLHNHSEIITLNPLVLSHRQISPPRDAPSDEARSTWYEITERIQFIPGLGKAGSSTISFNGVFHNVPWGLQTHIYAPMSIDMRAQYRIGGAQPGVEAAAPLELGLEQLGAPKEGLYLRADVQFKCNIALASFVKSTSIAAIGDMVSKMVKKAERMDADILETMIKEERSGNLLRIQSRESGTWQGQPLVQAQTYPQSSDHAPPPDWPLSQDRTEVPGLDSPDAYAYKKQGQAQYRQEAQQQPYPDGLPVNVSHAYPTIVAELDGGYCSATAEPGNWSQYLPHNNNYFYPNVGKSLSPRDRSPSEDGGRYHEQGSNGQQQQQYFQHQEYAVPPLFSAQRSYQPSHDSPVMGTNLQQQQQRQAPQFQSERKYSFDENRLQPEILNNGAAGRRWSAQYTRA